MKKNKNKKETGSHNLAPPYTMHAKQPTVPSLPPKMERDPCMTWFSERVSTSCEVMFTPSTKPEVLRKEDRIGNG